MQGSFTFIAGEVAKTGDMKVGTPVATMGIRGTAVQVDINLNDGTTKMSVLVEPNGVVGSFNVYSLSGTLIGTVNNAGLAAVIAPTGALNATMSEVHQIACGVAAGVADRPSRSCRRRLSVKRFLPLSPLCLPRMMGSTAEAGQRYQIVD